MVCAGAPQGMDRLVSVIVPVHNGETTIARALDSALKQSYEPIEIIVVDDASTDATCKILDRYIDGPLRVISLTENRGPSEARNMGIEAAMGAHIAFLDADDEWDPDKLSKQMALMESNHRFTLVTCQGQYRASDGGFNKRVYDGLPPAGGDVWRDLLAKTLIHTSCVLAPRQAVVDVGGFDKELLVGEDQNLWIHLASIGEVACVDEDLVTVHEVANSFMRRNITREADFVIPMIEKHIAIMRGKLTKGNIRAILGRRCALIGRNFYVNGGYIRGARLIARAIALGYQPATHLFFLLHASPPGRWLKHLLRGV